MFDYLLSLKLQQNKQWVLVSSYFIFPFSPLFESEPRGFLKRNEMIVCKKICLPEESILVPHERVCETSWHAVMEIIFLCLSTAHMFVHEYIHRTVLHSGLPCCPQKCDHELTDYAKDVSTVDGTVMPWASALIRHSRILIAICQCIGLIFSFIFEENTLHSFVS